MGQIIGSRGFLGRASSKRAGLGNLLSNCPGTTQGLIRRKDPASFYHQLEVDEESDDVDDVEVALEVDVSENELTSDMSIVLSPMLT